MLNLNKEILCSKSKYQRAKGGEESQCRSFPHETRGLAASAPRENLTTGLPHLVLNCSLGKQLGMGISECLSRTGRG